MLQPIHPDLLFRYSLPNALKVADLVDRVHRSYLRRVDVAEAQPIETLTGQAHRDALVGQSLIRSRAGTSIDEIERIFGRSTAGSHRACFCRRSSGLPCRRLTD